jgi:molecular chaperone DnaJ
MKNYYLILGVESDATMEQIRAAYLRQAKDLHPDYYGQDIGPFIDLQEAYAVLSDPARRRAYDDVLHQRSYAEPSRPGSAGTEPLFSSKPAPEPLIPTQEQADLGELSLTRSFGSFSPSFDELFGRLWRNFSLVRPKVERLRSLNVEIRISPKEALRGGRARLLVPARLRCQVCQGRGGMGFYACWQCDGAGAVQGEYPVILTFPPGVVNHCVVEIPLDRFGISNFYLRAIFRVSESRLSPEEQS